MSPNISFFHSGLNVNSNLFQFSLHTDKSFSAVKDFSNWSYLRSVIELQKNVSPGSITSTNTLFCCHNCQFFTAYVFVLPNTKKKITEGKACSLFRHSLTCKPFFCDFPSAEISFQEDRWGMNTTVQQLLFHLCLQKKTQTSYAHRHFRSFLKALCQTIE